MSAAWGLKQSQKIGPGLDWRSTKPALQTLNAASSGFPNLFSNSWAVKRSRIFVWLVSRKSSSSISTCPTFSEMHRKNVTLLYGAANPYPRLVSCRDLFAYKPGVALRDTATTQCYSLQQFICNDAFRVLQCVSDANMP